jgi:DNA-binding transcriptional ArsR family regulator
MSRRAVHPPTFRLTAAKREILEILAEYFCLRTNDVAELLRNRTPNENDKRSVRYTLGLLYRAGLVNRLPYLELDRESGGVTYVYGLSDTGVKFCSSVYTLAKTFDEHSQRTLDHELEISWFHMALKTFALKRNLTLYWQQADLKCTISPDAMFALTDPSREKSTLSYFLEMERAKIGHYQNGEPSIMRKLGKYYDYYGSDACLKEWGTFRQFRVIVVQRTDERRRNLLKELNAQYNHRMFWLTTEGAYKKDIGGEPFATPKDLEKTQYSFL